jgi:hypothetical protein
MWRQMDGGKVGNRAVSATSSGSCRRVRIVFKLEIAFCWFFFVLAEEYCLQGGVVFIREKESRSVIQP